MLLYPLTHIWRKELIMNIESIEKRKEKYLAHYEAKLEKMYVTEIVKIFKWFVKKYPKRTLEWSSGMGTAFWVLDGEILDCSDLEPDFNHWNSLQNRYGCKERLPDRRIQRLMPLWEFENSIHDMTYVGIDWIDIGNFHSDSFK